MHELIFPEVLIGLFLFFPLIRPLIKGLWPLDGLIWLPLLALGITAGLFPAYGFRPECVPLLVYGIIFNIVNFHTIYAFLSHLRYDDFRERSPVVTVLALIPLILVCGVALSFAHAEDTALMTRGVSALTLTDEERGTELFLRIYGPVDPASPGVEASPGIAASGGGRPLMVLIPPLGGSLRVIDGVCGTLRDQGFTVITYARRGFGPGDAIRLWRAYSRGFATEKANGFGRSFEEDRRGDAEFLLARLRDRRGIPGTAGTNPDCVFMAGYGVGGSALLLLAGAPNLGRQFPALRGIIALESPLFSALQGEEREAIGLPALEPGGFQAWWSGMGRWLEARRPGKITGLRAVPSAEIPICLILSGQALNPRSRDRRSGAAFQVVAASPAPAILTAVSGAGPLDYSDIPKKYPLYSLLFPGEGVDAWDADYFVRGTAALMNNFALTVLEGRADTPTPRSLPLKWEPIPPEGITFETGRAWNSLKSRYIL
jgi:predicted dienelactone hydrolase